MSENITVSFTIKVEICVVCKIEDCRSTGLSGQSKTEFIFLCPFIARNCLQCTWIAHFAILGIVKELHSVIVLAAFPDLVLETFRTAMKMVRTVIYRKRIFDSVQSKLSKSYSISKTSRHLSCAWTVSEITCCLRITQSDISQNPVLVWNDYRNDSCTYA